MNEPSIESFFSKPCEFALGVANQDQLPSLQFPIPEIAFTGRSNVGKSSLLNALLNRKSLARVSGTPGCTQQLNFFKLADELFFVDMPGYGYAKASKQEAKVWGGLINAYLVGRPQLRRVFMLVDSRRGILKVDEDIMKVLDTAAVSYQIVLTKCDELSKTEMEAVMEKTFQNIRKHPAAMHDVLHSSSRSRNGIDEVRQVILQIVKQ